MKTIQVTDEELEALHTLRNLTSQLSLSKKETREQQEEPEIDPDDIRINTYRDPKKGAWSCEQDNGITILHKPTGIEVKVNTERSAHRNKVLAMEELRKRLKKSNKHDPLQNLFDGAPVMVKTSNYKWLPRYFCAREEDASFGSNNKIVYLNGRTLFSGEASHLREHVEQIRLPTIEESPRNTWLAHDGTDSCPEGAENLDIQFRLYGEDIRIDRDKGGNYLNWHHVERFMILEK